MKTATLGQIRKVLELLEKVPQEQVQAVLEAGLLSDLFSGNISEVNRDEFRKVCGLVLFHPIIHLIVNRARPLAEMISAGKYDWVNEDITQEHFPVSGNNKEEEELVLFHFKRNISSDAVIAEMEKAGYIPGDIAGLLALGKNHPNLQKQFPIVALGSVWRVSAGCRAVPCLYWFDAVRRLDLSCLGSDWLENCRFLARRK